MHSLTHLSILLTSQRQCAILSDVLDLILGVVLSASTAASCLSLWAMPSVPPNMQRHALLRSQMPYKVRISLKMPRTVPIFARWTTIAVGLSVEFPLVSCRCHGPRPPPNPEYTLKPKKKKKIVDDATSRAGAPCPPCLEPVVKQCLGKHYGIERTVRQTFCDHAD